MIKIPVLRKKQAKEIIGNVQEEKVFYLNDGRVLRNLGELAAAMKDMGEGVFNHHVTSDRNDFRNWVNDVIGDRKLADSLGRSKTRESALGKINSRLKELGRVSR